MVYLVRTLRMLKFDDSITEKTKDLMEHIRKTYTEINREFFKELGKFFGQ